MLGSSQSHARGSRDTAWRQPRHDGANSTLSSMQYTFRGQLTSSANERTSLGPSRYLSIYLLLVALD
jgi:hypothetical protein